MTPCKRSGWSAMTISPCCQGLRFIVSIRRTALSFVLVWIVINFVFGVLGGAVFGVDAEIAWEAHLGGFVAGYLLISLFDGKGLQASAP